MDDGSPCGSDGFTIAADYGRFQHNWLNNLLPCSCSHSPRHQSALWDGPKNGDALHLQQSSSVCGAEEAAAIDRNLISAMNVGIREFSVLCPRLCCPGTGAKLTADVRTRD